MKSQIKAIVQVKEIAATLNAIAAFRSMVQNPSLTAKVALDVLDSLRDALLAPANEALDASLNQDGEAFDLASLRLQAAIAEVNTILLSSAKDPNNEAFNVMAMGWVQTLISANAVLLQANPVVEPQPKLVELTVLSNSNPSYKILVQRCAGDFAQADRLIRYEQEKDRSQSYPQATRAAILRLERDRCAV